MVVANLIRDKTGIFPDRARVDPAASVGNLDHTAMSTRVARCMHVSK